MNICRFCKRAEYSDTSKHLVKYGPRHYAHFKCYLEAGKSLDDLHSWQAREFPYRLLKEHGLLDHPKLAEDGR